MTWHILIIQWDAFWQLQEIIGVTLLLNYVFYVCVWCRVEGNSVFLEIIAQTRLSFETFVIPSDINDNNTAKRILRHHQGKKNRQKKKKALDLAMRKKLLF